MLSLLSPQTLGFSPQVSSASLSVPCHSLTPPLPCDLQPSFAFDGEWCDQFGTYLKVTDAAITGRGAGGFDSVPPGYTNGGVDTRHHAGEDVAQYFAQNRGANAFNPGLFSRFDWTTDHDDTVYMCQSVYDADSTATAANAEARRLPVPAVSLPMPYEPHRAPTLALPSPCPQPADVNDLDGTGCGGAFPWSALTKKEEGRPCQAMPGIYNIPTGGRLYWARRPSALLGSPPAAHLPLPTRLCALLVGPAELHVLKDWARRRVRASSGERSGCRRWEASALSSRVSSLVWLGGLNSSHRRGWRPGDV